MYQDTVTIFNKKPGGRGEAPIWYPTVIHGVNLNIDRAAILAKYSGESQDSAYLGIHYQKDGGEILVAGKPLMDPKKWDGTEDSITFGPDDFFWKGAWDSGIVTDADYGVDGFYGYMNKTHDYVFTISSVAIHSVIYLIEIMGK